MKYNLSMRHRMLRSQIISSSTERRMGHPEVGNAREELLGRNTYVLADVYKCDCKRLAP